MCINTIARNGSCNIIACTIDRMAIEGMYLWLNDLEIERYATQTLGSIALHERAALH